MDTTTTPSAGSVDDRRVPIYGTVLVPLDGSPRAERALAPAEWLACRLGAELHVVTADIKRAEAWWYQRYLDELTEAHPGLTVHTSSEHDVAATVQGLADELAPAAVCLATHGHAGSEAFVGPTYARIAAASAGPLVAVGSHARAPVGDPGRIVACVDGTAVSEAILAPAAAWARALGLGLSIVTVAEPTPRSLILGAQRHRVHGPDADPEAYVARLLGRPDLDGTTVDATVLWDRISPHGALLDHLEERPAALVAVAAHARTGMARVALGRSEGVRIVETVPVPVLVRPIAS